MISFMKDTATLKLKSNEIAYGGNETRWQAWIYQGSICFISEDCEKRGKILWLLQWIEIDEAGFMRLGTQEAPIKEHMILQIALR